jgi:hypothetical protein
MAETTFNTSLIPPFTYPAHSWVKKLRIIFECSDLDLTDNNVITKYLPIIISKLPPEIIDIMPSKCSISELLNFIESYDAKQISISEILSKKASLYDLPSVLYNISKNKFKSALSEQFSDLAIDELAWNDVKSKLPEELRTFTIFLNVINSPSQEQLKQLDCAFNTLIKPSRNDSIALVSQPSSSTTPLNTNNNLDEIDKLKKRIACLEKTVESLTLNINELKCSYEKNNYSVRTSNTSHNSNYKSNKQFCMYHRDFGEKAIHCVPPCNFLNFHGVSQPRGMPHQQWK